MNEGKNDPSDHVTLREFKRLKRMCLILGCCVLILSITCVRFGFTIIKIVEAFGLNSQNINFIAQYLGLIT